MRRALLLLPLLLIACSEKPDEDDGGDDPDTDATDTDTDTDADTDTDGGDTDTDGTDSDTDGTDTDADTDADTDTDGTDTDGTDTDGGDTDTDTDTDGTAPDIWADVETGNCEDVGGTVVAGADSHFVGEFSPSGGFTTGTETWALYANEKWASEGGSDCVVVWNISGSSASPGACGSCDYGVAIAATIDTGATTCPSGLYEGDESYTVTYGVDEDGGAARFYFATSGTLLGEGYVGGGEVSYISAPSCVFF